MIVVSGTSINSPNTEKSMSKLILTLQWCATPGHRRIHASTGRPIADAVVRERLELHCEPLAHESPSVIKTMAVDLTEFTDLNVPEETIALFCDLVRGIVECLFNTSALLQHDPPKVWHTNTHNIWLVYGDTRIEIAHPAYGQKLYCAATDDTPVRLRCNSSEDYPRHLWAFINRYATEVKAIMESVANATP